jgi:uncharacterized membrane protein
MTVAGDTPRVMTRHRALVAVVAVLGIVAGLLAASRQFLPVIVNRAPTRIGLFFAATTLVSFLVSPVAAFAAGYWGGRRVDLPTAYGRFALTLGVVGGIGTLVGFAVVVAAVGPDSTRDLVGFGLVGGHTALVRGVDFALTGLAGAAVAHFRAG